jgi:hypothetical protein
MLSLMRCAVVAGFAMLGLWSCSGGAKRPAPPAALGDDSDVVCPKAEAQPNSKPPTSFGALQIALRESREPIKACIRNADPIVPDLTYTLRVRMAGDRSATKVFHVEFLRIAGVRDRAPITEQTTAEACVAKILTSYELPPGEARSEMLTLFRYDDCMPKVYVAARAIHLFVSTAFPEWQKANPGKSCPEEVEDLAALARASPIDPWGRPYRLLCGPALPNGARGVGVMSLGRDGKANTADDVKSWDGIED